MHLASILEENGGEITPEIEEQLSINRDQLQTKGVNYALVIRQLTGESDMIDTEIKRLQTMKKSKDNTIDRMKNTIKDAMILHGVEKLQGDIISLSIRKSPDAVIVEDDAKIPDEYKVDQPKKIDKKSISNALKQGIEVPGASLKIDGKSLTIR